MEDGQALNGDYKALQYTIGEINYGGRITDEHDRRLMTTLMSKAFRAELLTRPADFSLIESGSLRVPQFTDGGGMRASIEFVSDLDLALGPEAFGLHPNADLQKEIAGGKEMLGKLMQVATGRSSDSASDKSKDAAVHHMVREVLSHIPPDFDLTRVQRYFPVSYENSMNQVLQQEVIRYNRLLGVIRETLTQLERAVKGLVVMSEDLEVRLSGIETAAPRYPRHPQVAPAF